MFLSYCILHSRKPIDYYQLHKDLWQFFPNFNSSSQRKSPFFYRIENPHNKGDKKILIQSVLEPVEQNIDSSTRHYNLSLQKIKFIGTLCDNLKNGQDLQFLVRAYPSKRLKKEGKITNRGNVRVPLRKDLEAKLTKDQVMLKWLKKIIEKGNYVSVKDCQIIENFPLRFKKKQDNKYHYGTIYTVTFKGYLRVNDPKQFFHNIILSGIGPGKAFGCGMLSIAKA